MSLIAFLSDGGIERYLVTQRAIMLGKFLARDGHEVHLFLKKDDGDEEKYGDVLHGIRLHYVCSSTKLTGVFAKYNLMKKYRFDMVHCLKPSWSFLSSILYKLKNPGLQLVIDHDELESKIVSRKNRPVVKFLEMLSFRIANKTIVSSRFLAGYFRKYIPQNKLLYLQYAINDNFIETDNVKSSKWKVPGKKILTYMGIYEKRYNHAKILDAMELLVREYEPVHLYFVGDGVMLDPLKRMVKERKLEGHVTFTGFLPSEEIPNILTSTDVFLFPIEDNFINNARCPYKIFQFIAANRPIVTNKVGEVYRTLGNYGIYYKYNSPEDLKEKIIEALHIDENKWGYPDEMKNNISWKTRYSTYKQFLFS